MASLPGSSDRSSPTLAPPYKHSLIAARLSGGALPMILAETGAQRCRKRAMCDVLEFQVAVSRITRKAKKRSSVLPAETWRTLSGFRLKITALNLADKETSHFARFLHLWA